MKTIILQPNDPRLGTLTTDGIVDKWPQVDIRGVAYERPAHSTRIIDGRYFVVLSVHQDDPEMIIKVDDSTRSVFRGIVPDELPNADEVKE